MGEVGRERDQDTTEPREGKGAEEIRSRSQPAKLINTAKMMTLCCFRGLPPLRCRYNYNCDIEGYLVPGYLHKCELFKVNPSYIYSNLFGYEEV